MRVHIVIFTLLTLLPLGATMLMASDLALVGAKVYPSPTEQPIENATILVHDGQITTVGPSTKVRPPRLARAVTVIDCNGRVVTAGFWNSHVHFTEPVWNDAEHAPAAKLEEHIQRMLTGWGFTTVFDIGSIPRDTLALRQRIQRSELKGPKIYTTAGAIYPKNGIPVYIPEDLAKRMKSQQAETAADGTRLAKQALAMGGDGIKVFAGAIKRGGVLPMPVEVIRAVTREAHAAGKPVFAHPSNHQGTDNALAGGVDVLAHTIPMETEFTSEELQKMKSQQVALTPTISLFPDEERKFGGSEEDKKMVAQRSIAQLKSYFDRGGTILFGTDVGYTQLYDTTSEFEYMSRAGMTWRDILASLTTNPAMFFKAAKTGRIANGMDADLVVLGADPATDVKAFANVAFTIRGGKVIYQKW